MMKATANISKETPIPTIKMTMDRLIMMNTVVTQIKGITSKVVTDTMMNRTSSSSIDNGQLQH
jgi:hypothetical protein